MWGGNGHLLYSDALTLGGPFRAGFLWQQRTDVAFDLLRGETKPSQMPDNRFNVELVFV
jgi:hypothetical protein